MTSLSHLKRLEAESIQILREVASTAQNPVLLYSVGKDSTVLLHLAMKAFYPAKPPFPLLHIDTTWNFRELIAFRDATAEAHGLDLIVHINEDGLKDGINPFDTDTTTFTDVMLTRALRTALDKYGFDASLGGARRDEERSRAKERVFSVRNAAHRWDPKSQRPELWRLYNTHLEKGQSFRVYPLSNWTEFDIWAYLYLEQVPIAPLYLAQKRPVVDRQGMLIAVDDDRMRLEAGEIPRLEMVRFRTLGDYPLSGAMRSTADTMPAILAEILAAKTSEREGRAVDYDQPASMERKKQEGYF